MKGNTGWIGLLIYILIWDLTASETLTGAFHTALRDPKKRWIPITIFIVVTAHLFRPYDRLPKRLDPIYRIGRISNEMPNL